MGQAVIGGVDAETWPSALGQQVLERHRPDKLPRHPFLRNHFDLEPLAQVHRTPGHVECHREILVRRRSVDRHRRPSPEVTVLLYVIRPRATPPPRERCRVGEAIVSAIGSADTHKDVLENPDLITKAVADKGLDSGTAFEILSIDIADIDVGQNIGAKLQADQAEADKRRFQAEAEKRRAMAIAQAAENRAKVEENRALVVLAEAEIPKAMAESFRSGNMGIMDYYRMKNIQADTQIRDSIGGGDGQPTEPKR